MKMRSMLGGTAALSLLQALSLSASACTEDGHEGIFPENNVKIPVSRWTLASDQETFLREVAKLQAIYSPVFAKQGRQLQIRGAWAATDQVEAGGRIMTGDTVNAFATRDGNTSIVQMFGGLFRHPLVTVDAFDMVICHELGHHLAGAPKKRGRYWDDWASNEGQSDYFATLKCAREIWKNEDNTKIVSLMEVPRSVKDACQKQFDTAHDVAICQRGAMAGKSLTDALGSLAPDPSDRITTDFEKPDSSVVNQMFDSHPQAQCRLDTYLAGALCAKSKDAPLSEQDSTAGVCSSEKGDSIGVRPLCWYKPETADR